MKLLPMLADLFLDAMKSRWPWPLSSPLSSPLAAVYLLCPPVVIVYSHTLGVGEQSGCRQYEGAKSSNVHHVSRGIVGLFISDSC